MADGPEHAWASKGLRGEHQGAGRVVQDPPPHSSHVDQRAGPPGPGSQCIQWAMAQGVAVVIAVRVVRAVRVVYVVLVVLVVLIFIAVRAVRLVPAVCFTFVAAPPTRYRCGRIYPTQTHRRFFYK